MQMTDLTVVLRSLTLLYIEGYKISLTPGKSSQNQTRAPQTHTHTQISKRRRTHTDIFTEQFSLALVIKASNGEMSYERNEANAKSSTKKNKPKYTTGKTQELQGLSCYQAVSTLGFMIMIIIMQVIPSNIILSHHTFVQSFLCLQLLYSLCQNT